MFASTLQWLGVSAYARRIRAGLRGRFSRILGRRAGRTLPIVLTQKRLYVLPTGFGFFMALMLLVSVAGGLNYNNNLALGFGFLFCALAFLSVHVAHRNLLGLEFQYFLPQPAFAGGDLAVDVGMAPGNRRERTCLSAEFSDSGVAPNVSEFELTAAGTQRIVLPAQRRGWQEVPPLTLSTQWPFGLFVVWSHIWPEMQALVYPTLERDPPALPINSAQRSGHAARMGDEDLRNLRNYRPGDAPRQIAWRASARAGELRTRELEAPVSADVVLEDQAIQGLSREAMLSRLAAWCVLADSAGLQFELRLNGGSIGPAHGPAHMHACLKLLALSP
jgi:uncharacterized protein (DUF58 family)